MLLAREYVHYCNTIAAQILTRTLRRQPVAIYSSWRSSLRSPEQSVYARIEASRYTSNIHTNKPRRLHHDFPIPLIRSAICEVTSDRISPPTISTTEPIDFSALFTHVQNFSPTFDRIMDVRNIVIKYLSSREDGLQFVVAFPAFVRALGREKASLSDCEFRLRTYNAVMYRLHNRKIPLNNKMISQGLFFASMAKSIAAVRYYLKLWAPGFELDYLGSLEILFELQNLIEQEQSSPIEKGRLKRELLEIMIGSSNEASGKPEQERQSCVYSIMCKEEKDTWNNFLLILNKLSGINAVYNEWLRFKASIYFNGARQMTAFERKSPIDTKRMIITQFIHILAKEDPRRAWQIIEESELTTKMLDHSTWAILLEHSEFLTWRPGMREVVLDKYEESIRNIERALGIEWSGGEDGYHVTSDWDQDVTSDF